MTLTKAVTDLIEEIENSNNTKEEKKAIKKFEKWLFDIKNTVSKNTLYWHTGVPKDEGYYLVDCKFEYKVVYWDGEKWRADFSNIEEEKPVAWHKIPEFRRK